jgi:GNAT superfamily N-acetyltransferase
VGELCGRFLVVAVVREGFVTHSIRSATTGDVDALARLFTALGHPTSTAELAQRWEGWAAQGNSALVAAADESTVVGVAVLHRTFVLHRPSPIGRITALVVDASARERGVGRALVVAAETALARLGCRTIEVTTNVRRTHAHAFYRRLGYQQTSFRFMKDAP